MTDPIPPTRTVRGPYAKGVATRQEILTAAIRVFARRGVGRTSLRAIAHEVGVTHAALIHHFGSLDQLRVEVYEGSERTLERVDPGPDDVTPVAMMRLSAERNRGVPGLVQLYTSLIAASIEDGHPAATKFATERFAALRSALAVEIEVLQTDGRMPGDVDARTIAALVIAASDGLQAQWMLDPDVDHVGALALLERLLDGGRTSGPVADGDGGAEGPPIG